MLATHSLASAALLKTCFESEHLASLMSGQETHDPTLRLTAQLVSHTQDDDLIMRITQSALPEGYAGNSLDEQKKMIEDARKKGFDIPKPNAKNPSDPNLLVSMVKGNKDISFFHDEMNEPFITYTNPEGGLKTISLKSDAADLWLRRLFYTATGKSISAHALKQAHGDLLAIALFDSEQKAVSLRIGRFEGGIAVNLNDKVGNIVVITSRGYEITKQSPVIFVNSPTMLSLPIPAISEADALKQFQNLMGLSDTLFFRVLAFIINCLKPEGPYLLLLTEGEQGSGKSFLSSILKMLIDPAKAPKIRLPDNEKDIVIQAKGTHLTVYDNISGIKAGISDTLSSFATGGGLVARKLYTDSDLQVFDVCRPVILNGITGIATRPDLLERSISIKLPVIKNRKTEAEMWQGFYELRPYLLDKLFNVVAHALANFDSVIAPTTIRMADAAKWIAAAEPATGLSPGTLLRALEASQHDIIKETMASNSLAVALAKLATSSNFEGTVGELFNRIQEDNSWRDRSFPKTSAHLSNALNRIRPALDIAGVVVELGERTRNGRMVKVSLKSDAEMELIEEMLEHGASNANDPIRY